MATRASTAALRRIGQNPCSESSAALRATRLANDEERERTSGQENTEGQEGREEARTVAREADVRVEHNERRIRFGCERRPGILPGIVLAALTLAAVPAAAKNHREDRFLVEHPIHRAEVENLQRWVSAGHADWCKDARLVAEAELSRMAPDDERNRFQLNEVRAVDSPNPGNRMTFEWASKDGRALYRVTVERFAWLLPFAKNTGLIVWVPTSIEMRSHE